VDRRLGVSGGLLAMMMLLVQASEPARDPCGDPRLVSQGYQGSFGTVREIGDSVTIVVDLDWEPPWSESEFMPLCSRKGCIVHLVNLLAPTNSTAAALGKGHLIDLCKGKRVWLSVSPYQDIPGVLNALARTESVDLNEAQLVAGFARYRSMGPYAVDWFTECKWKRAEARARESRAGLWRTN
jgi:hypothetical protein